MSNGLQSTQSRSVGDPPVHDKSGLVICQDVYQLLRHINHNQQMSSVTTWIATNEGVTCHVLRVNTQTNIVIPELVTPVSEGMIPGSWLVPWQGKWHFYHSLTLLCMWLCSSCTPWRCSACPCCSTCGCSTTWRWRPTSRSPCRYSWWASHWPPSLSPCWPAAASPGRPPRPPSDTWWVTNC